LKILVVHEVSYLKKIVYEFQIIPELLSILGHDVTIIDFDDTWNESPDRPVIDIAPKYQLGVHRAYENASVCLRHPGLVRLPFLARVSGALLNAVEVYRALRKGDYDAVLLYGVPTVGIQTWLSARIHGVPIVFRSIDISHQIVPSPVLAWPTRIIEKFVYKGVDGISALTPRIRDYVQSYGVPPSRVSVLPAGVDVERFSPGIRNDILMSQWGISQSDRVILFMGTIYRFSGLDRVIEDFPSLLSRHPTSKLLVVGKGEDTDRLRALSEKVGVGSNLVFTGVQDYQLLPDFIRSSDLCINPFRLNAITEDILPTKLFQYLACGRPLLATELPGTKPYLTGDSEGVVYSELANFVDAIGELLDSPQRCQALGERASRAMRERYDWKHTAESLVEWMEEIVKA
jgi:glycosyltransferase involved in cell wall biosynthesis